VLCLIHQIEAQTEGVQPVRVGTGV